MFDSEKALRVKKFIETFCTYSQGDFIGKRFKLLDWQWENFIKPFFGTVTVENYRQYRTAFIYIPKKNGKTELISALSIYMLMADGEGAPKVYVAACDREQAGLTYQAAATMIRNNGELSSRVKCLDHAKRIVYPAKSGFVQIISHESKTAHGLSPSCVIIDELHAHPTDDLYRVLTVGTDAARKQQAVFVTTTAGVANRQAIWWRELERAKQVRDGVFNDEKLLPVLFFPEDGDDLEIEETWRKVNPSLGKIFSIEKFRYDFEIAKSDPLRWADFLRFRLNFPMSKISKWIPLKKWEKCFGEIDIDALQGRDCFGGLDLSSKIDLTAFVLVFPPRVENEKYIIISKFYCPKDTIIERAKIDRVPYDVWERQGYLTATGGNVIDEEYIEKDIINCSKKYNIIEFGYDPWNATALAVRLKAQYGLPMVEVRQGIKTLSEPSKSFLTEIMREKLNHCNNPILAWNADNVVVKSDANANVMPDKEHAAEKIDGIVATIIAWSRMILIQTEENIYEKNGLLMV